MKLADKLIASLTCPPGRKDVLFADDAVTGFWVRIQASGAKSLLYRYKVGGVSRRVPLGVFG